MDVAKLCHVHMMLGMMATKGDTEVTQGGFRGWRNPWVQAGSSKGGCPQGLQVKPFPFWCLHGWHLHGWHLYGCNLLG